LRDIRQASPYRYVQLLFQASVEGSVAQSLAAMEGIRVLWERNGEIRCQVPRQADPQAILAAACRLGEVGYFRFGPPALSDLFREAVEA
jgi:ABC-type uncharacterized transport system ATPase subunit